MKKILSLIVLGFLLLYIYSCSPTNLLASGGATTMAIAEGERSFGTVVDDATIKINISAKFINSEDNLFININTTVLEGRVLLTGIVDNQEIRIDAIRRVWEVEGVLEVLNEIQIGNKSTLKEYAKDVWITAQAKAKATTVVGLKVVGYNFETIQGKVYIAGITTQPKQLEELIEIIKTIKGVKEIVNYVIVK
tara:strand:- start:107 stop:685 length:579 start_codon:yes stop_codon:yes gene_type:complete